MKKKREEKSRACPAKARREIPKPGPGRNVRRVAPGDNVHREAPRAGSVKVIYKGISVVKTISFYTDNEKRYLVEKYKHDTSVLRLEIEQGGESEIITI